MKKMKMEIINISQKKACIIGIISSLVYSIVVSFSISFAITEIEFINEELTIITLTSLFIPIFFIIFGIDSLGYIILLSAPKKELLAFASFFYLNKTIFLI